MEPEKINHPYLTAIKRTSLSVPTRYLLQHNLLKGRVLDFGCGYGFDTDELKRQGYDITGYDYYYRPEYPDGKFDTILCNYVLNVLEPYAQAEVMMNVTNLLAPTGTAFFAVRRDLTEEGFRLHAIHRQYTYQCNVRLPFQSLERNSSYELYQYQHFNKLPRKEGEVCPFCRLSRRVEIICETATCVLSGIARSCTDYPQAACGFLLRLDQSRTGGHECSASVREAEGGRAIPSGRIQCGY